MKTKPPPKINLADLPQKAIVPEGVGGHWLGVSHFHIASAVETAIGEITRQETLGDFWLIGTDAAGLVGSWHVPSLWKSLDNLGHVVLVVDPRLGHARPSIYWGDYDFRLYSTEKTHGKQTKGKEFCFELTSQIVESYATMKNQAATARQREAALMKQKHLTTPQMDTLIAEACRKEIIPWSSARLHSGKPQTPGEFLEWLREVVGRNPVHHRPRQYLAAFELMTKEK